MLLPFALEGGREDVCLLLTWPPFTAVCSDLTFSWLHCYHVPKEVSRLNTLRLNALAVQCPQARRLVSAVLSKSACLSGFER